MVARRTAPNRIGPGSVFPDASYWSFGDGIKGSPMASGPFWAGLFCQILIVMGYVSLLPLLTLRLIMFEGTD
jgi:alpha-1,3-glucan synthase